MSSMNRYTAKCSSFRSCKASTVLWLVLVTIVFVLGSFSVTASSSQQGMILRVRMADGSMERIQIKPGADPSLRDILKPFLSDHQEKDGSSSPSELPTIQIGSTTVTDDSQTVAMLGLKEGSLITLVKNKKNNSQNANTQRTKPSLSTNEKKASDRWDPFPEIAKDHEKAVRKTKTRRSSQGGMSFGDLADLQSSLHIVEPQQEGPLKRVYMCAKSAERFQTNCYKKSINEFQNRVGLLLGTIQRERVDLKPKAARTSLSSQTESEQYCSAVKVHALWEPPTQQPSPNMYDANPIRNFNNDPEMQRVFRLADLLGLRTVGWIFTYNDNRHKDEDSLPVYGQDAEIGSQLQIANMRRMGRKEGSQFVTLSMDATTGVTEAFQLSDVCVQMVAEDLWDVPQGRGDDRYVTTKHAVIVDGKETKNLDSVLCLVNTAMLSHEGSFAGSARNSVKKSGGVSNKVKKAIVSAIDNKDDANLLELLADFNLLLALDATLSKENMRTICERVRKYAQGQKRGTELDEKLKLLLRSMLDH